MSDLTAERDTADALACSDLMFNECGPAEAVEGFVGDDHRQHHPDVEHGKQAFVDSFERMAAERPGNRVEFERVLADGDFVLLHCQQIWRDVDDDVGIDILRLDDEGRVVEHWDVLQTMPTESASDNGTI